MRSFRNVLFVLVALLATRSPLWTTNVSAETICIATSHQCNSFGTNQCNQD
jgi:hypothetical protein